MKVCLSLALIKRKIGYRESLSEMIVTKKNDGENNCIKLTDSTE